VRSFAVGFREPAFDESAHARAVARHLGTDHEEWILTAEAAREAIPRLPTVYDEPFADTSQLPTLLVCQLARRHVTVALSGDGGDELFAGYDRPFRCLARWRALSAVPAPLRRALAGAAAALARAGAAAGGPRALGRLERIAEQLGSTSLRDLFAGSNARCPAPARFGGDGRPAPCLLRDAARWARVADPVAWMTHVDLAGRLPEDLLVKLDRASMAVGLEARCPLLDHRVVEHALRLPRDLVVRGGVRKWLLRRVLERHVPPALFERPKQGFGVPVGDWLRGPLRGWAEDLLAEPRLRAGGYLHAPAVRQVWAQHLAGWRDHRFLLWNLLSFEAWRDEGMGKLPRAC
jgi:asparagine synthase (glutamine-hydrolysing)